MDILAKNKDKIRVQNLTDSWMTPQEQFPLLLFHIGVLAHKRFLLGGILSLCGTPKWLCVFENVTRVSIDVGVSTKWVEVQF